MGLLSIILIKGGLLSGEDYGFGHNCTFFLGGGLHLVYIKNLDGL